MENHKLEAILTGIHSILFTAFIFLPVQETLKFPDQIEARGSLPIDGSIKDVKGLLSIQKIGVIHTQELDEQVARQKKVLKAMGYELVPHRIDTTKLTRGDMRKVINKALRNLIRREKIDAIWLSGEGELYYHAPDVWQIYLSRPQIRNKKDGSLTCIPSITNHPELFEAHISGILVGNEGKDSKVLRAWDQFLERYHSSLANFEARGFEVLELMPEVEKGEEP